MTRKLFATIFIITALAGAALAQTYKVGDKAEFLCGCFGPSEWVPITVELEQGGDTYRIRYGGGRYDYRDRILAKDLRPLGTAAKQRKMLDLHEQFRKEAGPYRQGVLYLMQVHDTKLIVNGSEAYRPPVRAEDWHETMQQLAALDTLCKTKYAGMTNDPNSSSPEDLDRQPATWCEIAARRVEYEKKGRTLAATDQFGPALRHMISQLQEVIDNPQVFIAEDLQLLMYERAQWRAGQATKFQKNFAALGLAMPDDFFAGVEAKADELKVKNEREAPSRSFLMPKQRDAAVEAFIRGRYATQKKGVQILKLGLDDATWQIHRNSLGVPTSQTKVARALVRIPNRPFCQEHSIAVEKQHLGGGRYGAMAVEGNIGSEGLFMSCN